MPNKWNSEELEVPELTEEQKKNQLEILKKLGKSKLSDSQLLKKKKEEACITDYKLILPHNWKLPKIG